MKIIIEKADLERIAEDILHEATMLSFTDEDDAGDDLSFYVPMIQADAERLKRLADESKPMSAEGGGR